jgi:hypothetical protein
VTPAGFNRRMRKTARPVVWKGGGAKSPPPHPIRPRAFSNESEVRIANCRSLDEKIVSIHFNANGNVKTGSGGLKFPGCGVGCRQTDSITRSDAPIGNAKSGRCTVLDKS